VTGTVGAANLTTRVPWVEWRSDAAAPASKTPVSITREANKETLSTSGSRLIQGTLNLNTAPPIVLRMLPWAVDPLTGYVNQDPALPPAGVNLAQRQRVGIIDDFLNNPLVTTPVPPAVNTVGRQHRPVNKPPFGFESPMALSELVKMGPTDPRVMPIADIVAGTPANNQQVMKLGLLTPEYRATSSLDFNVSNLSMTRVSNLASQRSDCFTVYVTVQAWTYVNTTANPTAQVTDTRLVGERRGSFVVDRSRISQTNFQPSDLIVYPVEQE
jgi:hypothetical protein